MATTLVLFEGGLLFTAVFALTVLWERPLLANSSDVAAVVGQALLVSLCCIVASSWSGLYDFRIVRRFGMFASRLVQSFGLALILLVSFWALFPRMRMVPDPFPWSLLIGAGLLLPLRAASLGIMRSRSFAERVLILGGAPLARSLIAEIEAEPHSRYIIVGVVDEGRASERSPSRYPLLGPLEDLGKIIQEVHPDRIIVAVDDRRGRLPLRHLLEARVRGIIVEDGVEMYERLTGKIAIELVTPSTVIFVKGFRKSRLTLAFGRALSLLTSVLGLLSLAPIFGLIALAIKLDSAGPVFFVQDRVGMGGKRFKLWKFRTMHPGNGETSEWVRDNGHRITRVGKWLRKFRLDELPQFVNILRGDMNLVGPRPHPVSNLDLFVMVLRNAPPCGEPIPYYALRLMVRPGLTGWAQVRYRYANDVDEEIEKVRYDLYYIKHMSPWFDLRILFETIKVIFAARESPLPDVPRVEDRRAGNRELMLHSKQDGSEDGRLRSWTVAR
jgi:exopolysaccharide biosynthesis polyprenyl glycosylphosphotransferase